MARRRYKSYKSRNSRNRGRGRGGKKSNLRWIIFLLVLITVGVFVIKKVGRKNDGDIARDNRTDVLTPDNPADELNELIKKSGSDVKVSKTAKKKNTNNKTARKVPDDSLDVLPPGGGGITSDQAKLLIEAASKDNESGKVIASRNKLNKALLEMRLSSKDRKTVKDRLTPKILITNHRGKLWPMQQADLDCDL